MDGPRHSSGRGAILKDSSSWGSIFMWSRRKKKRLAVVSEMYMKDEFIQRVTMSSLQAEVMSSGERRATKFRVPLSSFLASLPACTSSPVDMKQISRVHRDHGTLES